MRPRPRQAAGWVAAALVGLAVLALALTGRPGSAQGDAWALLKTPGHVVFLRHAATSGGFGDPPDFRLDDCASQRNLTDAGRAQAARTSEAFARNAVRFDRVLSSPWCRCRETAKLATGRDAETMDALSNLVGRSENRDMQIKTLRAYLAGLDPKTRVLFVTHGIVISALVGLNPAEGEMVIVKVGADGETTVAGRLKVD